MRVCEESLGRAMIAFFNEIKIPKPDYWPVEWDKLWLQRRATPAFLAALKEIEDVQLCTGFDIDHVIL